MSVIVTNHDYGRFLPAALDSALAQRGVDMEVLVVDNGSTDDSRETIATYGDRVRAILQADEGQKSAFNAGFAASTGEVIVFLDADDILAPGIASDASDAFARDPTVARVIWRLTVIDDAGRPTGATVPDRARPLPAGDVRGHVRTFPDDLAWPPTSGNAFAAWALQRLMPLAVDDDMVGADHDLHTLIPLLGPVVALDVVGGAYRVHGRNAHARDAFDVQLSRITLQRTERSHAQLDQMSRNLGYGPARPRSVTIAGHRLVSLRAAREGHPFDGDTRWRALRDGLGAALGRTDVTTWRRMAYCVWLVLVAYGPRALVKRLAVRYFQRLS